MFSALPIHVWWFVLCVCAMCVVCGGVCGLWLCVWLGGLCVVCCAVCVVHVCTCVCMCMKCPCATACPTPTANAMDTVCTEVVTDEAQHICNDLHSWPHGTETRLSIMTPETQPKSYLTSIFASVWAWSIPWCSTWAGQILSTMSWCQVAVLSGYDCKHVARCMHNAIQRVYGDTVHSSDMTSAYMHRTVPCLPPPQCCRIARVISHIQLTPVWKGEAYSTWVIPEMASQGPSDFTTLWDMHRLAVDPNRPCVCV